ncbi:MAG: D-glycero-beta-D-manno-heptose 1-phosphate adenylyltransferase, partial [Pseudomonadota bacterium]
QFVYGSVSRISPEAPVPVLNESHRQQMPGGAGNTARNLAALGARTRLIGVSGDDEDGRVLEQLLQGTDGIDCHLIRCSGLATVRKTRFVAGVNQMLRVDHEPKIAIDPHTDRLLTTAIDEAAPGATAIVISDYAKGSVTGALISAALRAGLAQGAPVIVDPKGVDFARYGPVDLIKPNANELAAMTGLATQTDAEITAALQKAMSICGAKTMLVTRAAKGLSYLIRGGDVQHMQGEAREVFDVSGAGDTSLAALGIALSAGASMEEAARLAIAASGLAVTKSGTATISAAELLASEHAALLSIEQLADHVDRWRSAGQSVGFTNGCFDILHPGHLKLLEEAKARCGRLIVGLNSDASVRRLKGAGRPVHAELARARVLSALSAVDGVVLFEEDTPLELIKALQPDVLVKGGDYTRDTIVGASEVIAAGGDVHIVPLVEGFSTTSAIEKAAGHSRDQSGSD